MGRDQRGGPASALPGGHARTGVRQTQRPFDDASHGAADRAGEQGAWHCEDEGLRRKTMDVKERERLIALYRDGYRAVADALHNIEEEELDARRAPGKWSAREIV